jgi:CheY-like chemotaxis protein
MATKKVLLVDDDAVVNFINRLMLTDHDVDCTVAEANDGQQAIEHIMANGDCPDVILLDINMPGMDGFEFLAEYEKRGKCCLNSKIYMLTSSPRQEEREKALTSRFVKGFFDKPLAPEHIREMFAHCGKQ